MHRLLFLLLIPFLLIARDNPFLPANDNKQDSKGVSNNRPVIEKEFRFTSTTLPDSARVLEKVVFVYKNLDGSIKEKPVKVQERIDWHMPLVVTQGSPNISNQPLVLPEDKEEVRQAEVSSVSVQVPKQAPKIEAINNEVKQDPVVKKQLIAFPSKNPFITLYQINNELWIQTQDHLKRDFIIVDPHRIVLDFSRNTTFYTKSIQTKSIPYIKVDFGNHKGYYRVVITLDGKYRYRLQNSEEGYLLMVE
jgi:hypothetical protein